MSKFATRAAKETRTYELFETVEWDPEVAVVALVFKAMWHAALTQERIERIGAAMAAYDKVDLSAALTKLLKAKVLRSYRQRGKRRYEVNY